MSRYQHKKGQIKDNAIEALLHDPLFRQRVEKNKKGKGSYLRKGKHGNRGNWEASGKKVSDFFTTGLLLLRTVILFFSKSRISPNNTSSLEGAGGAAGSSAFLRLSLLISLMATKIAKATITKSNTFWINTP